MSSEPKPHLLTLPREIRNIIYTHLFHSISFDWGYQARKFPIGGHRKVQICVPNAPFVNFMLSCQQIYQEYCQDRRFRNFAVTIDTANTISSLLLENEETNQNRTEQIFKRAQRVEILVDETVVARGWGLVQLIGKLVAGIASRLEMMSVRAELAPKAVEYVIDAAHARRAPPARAPPVVLPEKVLLDGEAVFWEVRSDLMDYLIHLRNFSCEADGEIVCSLVGECVFEREEVGRKVLELQP